MNAATQPGNFNELNFIDKSYLVKDLNGPKYCVEDKLEHYGVRGLDKKLLFKQRVTF